MTIQEIFDTPAIQEIEKKILDGYNFRKYIETKETIKTLLDIRFRPAVGKDF